MDEFLKDIIKVDEAPQSIDEVAAGYWFEEFFIWQSVNARPF